MKRLTRSLAAVALVAGAAVVVNVTPAQAAGCTDAVCVYKNASGDVVAGFTTADNNFSNNTYTDGSSVNDSITRVSVHQSRNAAMFYTDSYWRGHARRFENLGHSRIESAQPYNDQYSSFRYVVID